MTSLICFFLLVAVWLTILTKKNREQKVKNKILENQNKYYKLKLKQFKLLRNGKEETDKGEEANQNT